MTNNKKERLVSIPIAGIIYVPIRATSDEQAIKKVLKNLGLPKMVWENDKVSTYIVRDGDIAFVSEDLNQPENYREYIIGRAEEV